MRLHSGPCIQGYLLARGTGKLGKLPGMRGMSVQKVLKDLEGRARNYRPIKESHSFSDAQPKALKIKNRK
jgi:hypothetical protein